jgi:hypothetical protein
VLERLHKQLVDRAAEKSRMADALTMRPTRLQSSAYGASQSRMMRPARRGGNWVWGGTHALGAGQRCACAFRKLYPDVMVVQPG